MVTFSSKLFLCALCLLLPLVIYKADAFFGISRATLYEDTNQEGDAYFLRVDSECTTLPQELQNWASSVNTHGTCILVCLVPHCRTRCFQLYPGSPGHYDLSEINANDQIMSLKSCDGYY